MDRQEDLGGRQPVTDAFDLLLGDLPATGGRHLLRTSPLPNQDVPRL